MFPKLRTFDVSPAPRQNSDLGLIKSFDRKFVLLKSVLIDAQAVLDFGRRQTLEGTRQNLRIDGLPFETK